MALTKKDLFNQALGRVGAQHITDIEDTENKAVRVCDNVFEPTVREVSRSGDWNCLRKRVELDADDDAPAFEWAVRYPLPTDFIRLCELNGVEYHNQPQDEWELEGQWLLTDADKAQVQYVSYVANPALWDALFFDAVVVLLASKIAVPMRQDESMAASLRTEYERVTLPRARVKDGNEQRNKRFNPAERSRFLQSRHYSTNG